MAGAIDDREAQNRAVLAEQPVRDDGADHRERVDAGDERVHVAGCICIRDFLRQLFGHDVEAGQMHEQDRFHSVERKAFASFITDDEGNAGRPAFVFVVGRGSPLSAHSRVSPSDRLRPHLK